MTIYPNVKFNTGVVVGTEGRQTYYTQIHTHLRKQHTDGKWYLQYFFKDSRSEDQKSIEWCVNDFNRDIHLAQMFGKVLPDLRSSSHGDLLFKLDDNQQSEEERLKKL